MDLWHVISHVWTYYCTAERSVPDRFLNLFCRIYFLLRWYLLHQFVSSFCDFAFLPSVTFLGVAESRFRKTSRNDQTNSHTSKHKPLEWKQIGKSWSDVRCGLYRISMRFKLEKCVTFDVQAIWCICFFCGPCFHSSEVFLEQASWNCLPCS